MRASFVLLSSALLLSACIAPQPAAKAEPVSVPSSSVTATPAATAPRHCRWPSGAEAAVSLTYDDALGSQLRYALPVLDAAGIKATFFLSGGGIAAFAP